MVWQYLLKLQCSVHEWQKPWTKDEPIGELHQRKLVLGYMYLLLSVLSTFTFKTSSVKVFNFGKVNNEACIELDICKWWCQIILCIRIKCVKYLAASDTAPRLWCATCGLGAKNIVFYVHPYQASSALVLLEELFEGM